jgi:hypothetical protein
MSVFKNIGAPDDAVAAFFESRPFFCREPRDFATGTSKFYTPIFARRRLRGGLDQTRARDARYASSRVRISDLVIVSRRRRERAAVATCDDERERRDEVFVVATSRARTSTRYAAASPFPFTTEPRTPTSSLGCDEPVQVDVPLKRITNRTFGARGALFLGGCCNLGAYLWS